MKIFPKRLPNFPPSQNYVKKTGDTVKKMLTKDPIQLAKEITKRGYGSDTQELLSMIKKGNKEKSDKHTHRKEPQKN